ncbi:TPA: UDP-N-acetylmuramoyl-L-alanine--D-glutamate ligase [Patescibacteria group bacterium]|nr:UDP-N-acetylmuramoyl-L-alanine--D-glutamate ligase [Patescibacteria group bacterium]
MKLKGKKVLVVGLGLQGGGLATVRWLLHQRARVSVTDLKNRRQLESSLKNLGHLPIKFVLGKHPLSLLRGVDLVVQNPAVPNSLPLIRRAERLGIPIEGEASIFLKMCPAPVIAVTGSKGKSTVASWLGFMFKNAGYHTMVAGNIRDRLMLSILPNINPNTKVVLELSSWQLENLGRFKLSPPLAVITNILPDHLDRYKNMSQYAQAKANIWRWQSKSDKAVLNWDNIITRKLGRLAQSKIFWFSTQAKVSAGCYIYKKSVWFKSGQSQIKLFSVKDVALAGAHNLANALAAATTAVVAGVPPPQIRRAVLKFIGLHSRQQLVREVGGVKYINDTTATMPDATQKALDTFKKYPITLIAGGYDKKLSYAGLARDIRRRVQNLILLPGSATKNILAKLPKKYPYIIVKTMAQAIVSARRLTARGGVVLMSPAAASFGLFINEWDRGEQFVKAVRKLK